MKSYDLSHPIFSAIPAVIFIILLFLAINFQIPAEVENVDQEIQQIENLSEQIKQDIKELDKSLDEKYEYLKNHLNYMNRVDIRFNPDNLRELSNLEAEQLEGMLNGTNFGDIASIFVEAEKRYNVNALFLVALAAHESAWGTSRLAVEKNNLTGFTAYNDNPFNSGKTFNSWDDSILTTARKISENYLDENGKYYNGASVEGVNTRYAVLDDGSINKEWSKGITWIATDLKTTAVAEEKAIYLAGLQKDLSNMVAVR